MLTVGEQSSLPRAAFAAPQNEQLDEAVN